jgi:hypothetical protein
MSQEIDIYNYPTDPKLVPAYRIAVMQAALEGKRVEYQKMFPKWGEVAEWLPITSSWNWETFRYRIAAHKRTQEQKDRDAYIEWLHNAEAADCSGRSAWLAALKYERSRNA